MSQLIFKFLIKSLLDDLTVSESAGTSQEQLQEIIIKHQATSRHHSAAQGIRTVQSSSLRSKDTLLSEEHGKWKIIMTCHLLLFNLKARLVGIKSN